MLSKNTVKLIKSLNIKKNRIKNNLFLVEGNKSVTEILNSEFIIKILIGTKEFIHSINKDLNKETTILTTTQQEINKASLLKSPQQAMALCSIPEQKEYSNLNNDELYLCLDTIQDPGNLGTIIRIADWFGIKTLFASYETADIFNPKTVQATSGSISRVSIYYTDLFTLLKKVNNLNIPIYGAFLKGKNIYNQKLYKKGMIVIGNEGNGISKTLHPLITNKLFIPKFNHLENISPESLNAAIATAIICSEFRRVGLVKN